MSEGSDTGKTGRQITLDSPERRQRAVGLQGSGDAMSQLNGVRRDRRAGMRRDTRTKCHNEFVNRENEHRPGATIKSRSDTNQEVASGNLCPAQPKHLTQTPSDPISVHRTPDRGRYRKGNAQRRTCRSGGPSHSQRAASSAQI